MGSGQDNAEGMDPVHEALRHGSDGRRYALLALVALLAGGCSGGTPGKQIAEGPSGGGSESAALDLAEKLALPEGELEKRGFTSHWVAHPVPVIHQAWFLLDDLYITRPGEKEGYLLEKIDGETGRLIWSHPLEGKLVQRPDVYRYPKELRDTNDDEIFYYQHLEEGGEYIIAMNDKFGTESYRIKCDFPVSTPPVASQDYVFIGSWNNRVYAMTKKTRLEEWSYLTDGPITAPLEVGEAYVFVGSEDKVLYAFNQGAGAVRGKFWRYLTQGVLAARPTFHKGRVFLGSWDHKVYCIDLFQGYKRWAYSTGGPVTSAVFPFSQWVFAIAEIDEDAAKTDGKRSLSLVALDVADGKLKWESLGKKEVLAADNFHCFAVDGSKRIHALSIDTGEPRWNLDVSAWDFVIGQDAERGAATERLGRIFLARKNGVVQCIRPRR